jgi:hypothetical protein
MRRLYQFLLKPILFRFDPERVHDLFVNFGEALGRSAITRRLVALVYGYHGADAAVTVDGITYRTPVLLAAGFDYNGRLTRILKSVAFGGVEIGSVTARPTVGNSPPRLTRLIRSKSLLVNKGCAMKVWKKSFSVCVKRHASETLSSALALPAPTMPRRSVWSRASPTTTRLCNALWMRT